MSRRLAIRLLVAAAGVGLAAPEAWSQGPQPPPGCPEQLTTDPGLDDGCAQKPALAARSVPDISSFKTPESPAFMALGLAPSEIQRPTTPTGFALATAAGLTRAGRLLPGESFALEAAPYWLFDHVDLTYDDLEGQRWRSIYRNFTISLATATQASEPPPVAPAPAFNSLSALGLRTTVLSGRQSRAARLCQSYLRDYVDRTSAALARARQAFDEQWYAEHPRPAVSLPPFTEPSPPQDRRAEVEAWIARAQAWKRERDRLRKTGAMDEYLSWARAHDEALATWLRLYQAENPPDPGLARCLNAVHDRDGLMLEVAAAGTLVLPEADLERLTEEGRRGFIGWATLAYVLPDFNVRDGRSLLDASAVFAYRHQREKLPGADNDLHVHDLGLRAVTGLERYGLGIEYTQRFERSESSGDWRYPFRLALTVDYRLAGGAWFTATFAKEFGVAGSTPLLALANLQWNFALDRGVRVDSGALAEGGGR
jgi:hypothetical protein